MEHYIAYEGLLVSLALMQKEYGKDFLRWANEREGVEGTLQRPPYTWSNWEAWVAALDRNKGTEEVFAILLHEPGEKRVYRYVGHTGIHHARWPEGRGTTGSIIGDPSARARGCGTEAKLLLLRHAFLVMGLRKVTSSVKAWNARSLGHLIKCGYKIVGRYREHTFHEGAFVDEIVLEVFPKDWKPIWEAYRATGQLPKLTDEQRTLVACETSV